jgi:F-type H+-transporting ATPase subunit gamma
LLDEDVDSPLTSIRVVKSVLLVVVTGDRGLCGGYNNYIIKKAVARIQELNESGVNCKVLTIGSKGTTYFKRRSDKYNLCKQFMLGGAPTSKEAQEMADEIFSEFVSAEVDKVELLFTKFVSLINSQPSIQTLLPMARSGELCDINGKCVDFAEDEIFRLTTTEGKMSVTRAKIDMDTTQLDGSLIFEQEPSQILDALLPLYMNSTVLRSLQESVASELAARMNAMNSASDNAAELRKTLSLVYNRQRQAAITSQLIEIVSGANAV